MATIHLRSTVEQEFQPWLSSFDSLYKVGVWEGPSLEDIRELAFQKSVFFSNSSSFVPAGGVNESNMAVMEVNFPSGFTADLDTLPSLEVSENVKKVETKNGDTTVVVYFDNLGSKELCPTLDAFRTHKVAKQKPSPVVIYDYYDNCKHSFHFYIHLMICTQIYHIEIGS